MQENIEDKMAKIICKTDIERLATIFANQQLRVLEKAVTTLKIVIYSLISVILAIVIAVVYIVYTIDFNLDYTEQGAIGRDAYIINDGQYNDNAIRNEVN